MKRLIIAILTLTVAFSAFAQIDPTVEVNRDYEGSIASYARKPLADTEITDSLKHFDVSFDYSIFDKPYKDLYEFSPYQAASLGVVQPDAIPHFSAKVAGQYPFMTELNIYTQLVSGKKVNFGIYGVYEAEKGQMPTMIRPFSYLQSERNKLSAGADFKYAWNKGEFNLSAAFKHSDASDAHGAINTFVAPGIAADSLKHLVNSIVANFNIRSTDVQDHNFYYDINGSYFNSTKGLSREIIDTRPGFEASETALVIKARVGSSFEEHRMYVDVKSLNNWYDKHNKYYLGVIEFTPIYRYSKERFDARLGIRFGNRIGLDNKTSIFPDIDAKFELIKNNLWIRAVAFGGNDIENLSDDLYNAPWLMPSIKNSTMRYTSRPLDLKLSTEGIIGSRLGFNFYGTYTSFVNKMQLYTDLSCNSVYGNGLLPYLYTEYVDYVKLSAGAELTWTSKDFRMFASIQGNKYKSSSSLYMLPKVEAMIKAEYNLKERLFISSSFVYQGIRESQLGQVPEYMDLSAKIEFKVNRFFSIYAKGGNLLNRENYIYAGISHMPINAGGGICINF